MFGGSVRKCGKRNKQGICQTWVVWHQTLKVSAWVNHLWLMSLGLPPQSITPQRTTPKWDTKMNKSSSKTRLLRCQWLKEKCLCIIPANPDWIQGKFYRKPEEKGSEQTSSCEDSLKSTHWNIASPRSMFIPLQDGAPPSYQLVYNPHEY